MIEYILLPLGLTIFYLFYSLYLKPKSSIAFYTKQGAYPAYVPLIGWFGKNYMESANKGDNWKFIKDLPTSEASKYRFIASN